MTKYKTEVTEFSVSAKITPVEVEKETDQSVWVEGYRHAKKSQYHQYHDTWEEAHGYLLSQVQSRVDSARMILERAKGALGNIKGMKKP